MKKLPLGLQTFSKVIEKNCVYVDKTEYIYNLIQGNYVFFSRPRRFGKSLLCSTLNELFLGNRDLFKGLWIDTKSNYDWKKYPVIYLDLSMVSSSTPEDLKASLVSNLNDIVRLYKLGKIEKAAPGDMLKKIVIELKEKYKQDVVIIIDEYDSPILNHIGNLQAAMELQSILKNFYTYIKGLDACLRFVFITGITRFSKTTIFSGLNQLDNISMDKKYAHLVGYTQDEISFYFQEHIDKILKDKTIDPKGSINELKEMLSNWYNGYRFWGEQQVLRERVEGKELARLYSPFSVLSFLDKADFRNYWFESGTPSFLIKILELQNYPIEAFGNLQADENELMTFDIANIPLAALLFQAGYATIKDYDSLYQRYSLDMPNYEVKDSLLKSVLTTMTKHSTSTINNELIGMRIALEAENLDSFIDKIKKFYSSIPYTITIDKEKYYQTVFFLLLKLINLRPEVERATNIGRIDLLVETRNIFYIFEFKLNSSVEVALQQIIDMKYYEAYENKDKKIKMVGVNFSSDEKNITGYLFKDLI